MFIKTKTNKVPLSPAFTLPGEFHSRSFGLELNVLTNSKIVVFGLPKTGNVWLVSLISDYLSLNTIDPYLDVKSCGVGMCHRKYSEYIANRKDFIHGIYLIRDIRDVIVSYFYNTQRKDWQKNFPHFHYHTIQQFYFEWFLPRVTIAHDIKNHPYPYIESGLPIVRYEDLYDDPENEFIRLIKRLGFKIDLNKVSIVIKDNNIEKLQINGKKLDINIPKEHFRRGGYGGFRKELPEYIIKHINKKFIHLLEEFGYEI